MNIIRMILIMIAVLVFLTILILININKTTESQKSTLLRILTNYLLVVSTTMSFGANFPSAMNDIFYPADIVGSSSEAFVSFDCFVMDKQLNSFAPTSAMFKMFLATFLPIVLILIYSGFWLIMYFVMPKRFKDLKRNITISSIAILFLLHTTLTRFGLSIFQCTKVDESDFRVKVNLNMK